MTCSMIRYIDSILLTDMSVKTKLTFKINKNVNMQ